MREVASVSVVGNLMYTLLLRLMVPDSGSRPEVSPRSNTSMRPPFPSAFIEAVTIQGEYPSSSVSIVILFDSCVRLNSRLDSRAR